MEAYTSNNIRGYRVSLNVGIEPVDSRLYNSYLYLLACR